MDSTTNNLLAERYLGSVTYEDYIDWAVKCLESDIDSKNIRILASLQKLSDSYEVENYFNRSLNDLGWKVPDERECLMAYARGFAEQIVSGAISPVEGCDRIYRIVLALQYPREMSCWIFLDERLDPEGFSYLHGPELDQAIVSAANRFINEQ